ncbi:DUF4435 domain-containing protein [Sunxiuqinia rutila]|uniref:DUF4435 domain-containing protein n=1 Tax=Sunxiuqinia rutila TaxID=1397841 RepID=UPI003D35F394
MLKYNYNTLSVLSNFFKYRNDIDIFTEDKIEDKEFYKLLFNRLVGEEIKINDITPLGCKTNVLRKYDELKNENSRRRLFIVDGDLELINGENRSNDESLFVLNGYCIENFIICEQAAIELLYLSNSEDKEVLRSRLSFSNWLKSLEPALIDLFLHLALLRVLGGGPKLKKASDFLVQKKGKPTFDLIKLQHYRDTIIVDIILIIRNAGEADPLSIYISELNRLRAIWTNNTTTLLQIVSGKNYLLPLLNFHIKACINKGSSLFDTKSFKMVLARFCNLNRLDDLRAAILK